MGRKYGSLHIRTENVTENTDALISSCIDAMDSVFHMDVEKAAALLGLNLPQQQIPLLRQLTRVGISARTKQNVVKRNGFVSLYDQRVTFENIQAVARKLSDLLKLPILYSSVYDDDVFIFGLCENGKTVSVHISGDCEAYGLTPESDNIEGLERYLSNDEGNLPELKNLSGADFESALSKALGFRLDSNDR
ncbi:MAG: hypothetical protein Q4E18_11990 [Clostridia bacterium]|nr:hypothetical protein [Clostridia bacterium]